MFRGPLGDVPCTAFLPTAAPTRNASQNVSFFSLSQHPTATLFLSLSLTHSLSLSIYLSLSLTFSLPPSLPLSRSRSLLALPANDSSPSSPRNAIVPLIPTHLQYYDFARRELGPVSDTVTEHSPKAFLPVVAGTDGLLHADPLRLLWTVADRQGAATIWSPERFRAA
eukprot:762949-Hanusia_phi.AAC.16